MKKVYLTLILLIVCISPVLALDYDIKKNDVILSINSRGMCCGNDPSDNEIYCALATDGGAKWWIFNETLDPIYSHDFTPYTYSGCSLINSTHIWVNKGSLTFNDLVLLDIQNGENDGQTDGGAEMISGARWYNGFSYYSGGDYTTYWGNGWITNSTGHFVSNYGNWRNTDILTTIQTENNSDLSRIWWAGVIGSSTPLQLWNGVTNTDTGIRLDFNQLYDFELPYWIYGMATGSDNSTIWAYILTNDDSGSTIYDMYRVNFSEALEFAVGNGEQIIEAVTPYENQRIGTGEKIFQANVNSELDGNIIFYTNNEDLSVNNSVIYNESFTGSNETQLIQVSLLLTDDDVSEEWTWVAEFTDVNTNVWTTGDIPFIIEAVGVLNYVAKGIGGVLGIDDLEIQQTVMSFILALIVGLGVTYRFSETGAKEGLWKIFITVFVGSIAVLWLAGFVADIIMLVIVSFIVVTFAKQLTATASGSAGGG